VGVITNWDSWTGRRGIITIWDYLAGRSGLITTRVSWVALRITWLIGECSKGEGGWVYYKIGIAGRVSGGNIVFRTLENK
jgi:hypothetical protein